MQTSRGSSKPPAHHFDYTPSTCQPGPTPSHHTDVKPLTTPRPFTSRPWSGISYITIHEYTLNQRSLTRETLKEAHVIGPTLNITHGGQGGRCVNWTLGCAWRRAQSWLGQTNHGGTQKWRRKMISQSMSRDAHWSRNVRTKPTNQDQRHTYYYQAHRLKQ